MIELRMITRPSKLTYEFTSAIFSNPIYKRLSGIHITKDSTHKKINVSYNLIDNEENLHPNISNPTQH